MTASGLYYSGYVPESLLGDLVEFAGVKNGSNLVIALLAAAIVQSGIFIVYMSFSLSPRIFTKSNVISAPIFLLLVGFSGFVSCYSILLNSRGESLEQGFENRVTSVRREIVALDAQMSSSFSAQLDSFRSLAEQSRRGEDSSGVARCGPICRENIDKARLFESEYGAVILPAVQDFSDSELNSISDRFTILRGMRAALDQKFASFNAYCLAESRVCSIKQLRRALDNVDRHLDELSDTILDAPPNRNLLILNKTSEVYFRPWLWLVPEFNLVVPLLIAFLPDFVSVLMMLAARSQLSGD